MTNLSHWDFAEQFQAKEAAELILGIIPERNDGFGTLEPERVMFRQKITPVLRRMKRAYEGACNTLDAAVSWDKDIYEGLKLFPADPVELHSEVMVKLRQTPKYFPGVVLTELLDEFEVAYFDRDEIQRWLDAIGMKSVYRFNHKQIAEPKKVIEAPAGYWPWGNHHTELLGHLEAAARRYWGANYDPSDASTAPINVTVSEWLQTERKVSRTMADSIASILRADGLPTGPRK